MKKLMFALGLLAAGATAQAATPIFSDSFDSNAAALNATPTGWSIDKGTVDIIGAGTPWDYIPGSGLFIDLDGSTGNAGMLFRDFDLTAGLQYTLNFDLAGNHVNSAQENVQVKFGNVTEVFSLPMAAGWTPYSLVFTPNQTKTYTLSFWNNNSNDNVGMLLDNVNVTAVPEPETYAMMLAGLGLVGFMARRRRKA